MRNVPAPGEPLDLIDLKFLPAWVKEDWSVARHARFEGEEEQAHWPRGVFCLCAGASLSAKTGALSRPDKNEGRNPALSFGRIECHLDESLRSRKLRLSPAAGEVLRHQCDLARSDQGRFQQCCARTDNRNFAGTN